MKKQEKGFTLLEIMIVVSIIAVLLSLAIFKLKGNLEMSKSVAVQADLRTIGIQLKAYESMNGFMPSTEQGLQALVARPTTDPTPARWMQFLDSVPKDPYHNDYIYKNPGVKNPGGYDLYSAGPDRLPGTADDDWGQ
ncbi:MAG: type II secretion system major pseudopilin GspG [Chthoniobacterales bacterium]